jgi:hypothetical protein
VGKEHALHLKHVLEEHYQLTCDWDGCRYIGITLDWDYQRWRVHLSMPGFVKKALKLFQHQLTFTQDVPYPSVPIWYGAKQQYAMQESTGATLECQ